MRAATAQSGRRSAVSGRRSVGRYACAVRRSDPAPFREPPINRLLESVRGRSPLPAGTSPIAVGLVVNGLATYAFLVIADRTLGEDLYSSVAVLWSLVYILGPGLFQPLEQEVTRATADRRSRRQGSLPVLHVAGRIGAVAFAAVAVGVIASWPLGLAGLLYHEVWLLAGLLLSLAAFAGAQLVRGILSGRHLFNQYGSYFAAEGLSRLCFVAGLAIVGVQSVGAYAAAMAAAFATAALVASRTVRPFARPGPPYQVSELTPKLGLLLAASVSEAFLLNVGPVALRIVGDDLPDAAPGVFFNGLIISRVPLFFFQAVKASLLPNLASLAGRGDLKGFRNLQIRLSGAVTAAAVTAAAGGWLIGPWVVRVMFGSEIGARDMLLLAASGGGLMVMLSLSLGLVALDRIGQAAAGHLVGVLVFPIVMQVSAEPFLRVEMALLSSVAAGALATALLLRRQYAQHAAAGRLPARH